MHSIFFRFLLHKNPMSILNYIVLIDGGMIDHDKILIEVHVSSYTYTVQYEQGC